MYILYAILIAVGIVFAANISSRFNAQLPAGSCVDALSRFNREKNIEFAFIDCIPPCKNKASLERQKCEQSCISVRKSAYANLPPLCPGAAPYCLPLAPGVKDFSDCIGRSIKAKIACYGPCAGSPTKPQEGACTDKCDKQYAQTGFLCAHSCTGGGTSSIKSSKRSSSQSKASTASHQSFSSAGAAYKCPTGYECMVPSQCSGGKGNGNYVWPENYQQSVDLCTKQLGSFAYCCQLKVSASSAPFSCPGTSVCMDAGKCITNKGKWVDFPQSGVHCNKILSAQGVTNPNAFCCDGAVFSSSSKPAASSRVSSAPSNFTCPISTSCMTPMDCIIKGNARSDFTKGVVETLNGCKSELEAYGYCCGLKAAASSKSFTNSLSSRSATSSSTKPVSSVPSGTPRMRLTFTRAESTDPAATVHPFILVDGPTPDNPTRPPTTIPSGQWVAIDRIPLKAINSPGPYLNKGTLWLDGKLMQVIVLNFHPETWSADTHYSTYYGTLELEGGTIMAAQCRPTAYIWYCPEREHDGSYAAPNDDEVYVENGVVHFYIHPKNVSNIDGNTDIFYTYYLLGDTNTSQNSSNVSRNFSSAVSRVTSSARSAPFCLSGDVCIPYEACLDKGGKLKDPGACNPDAASRNWCCQLPTSQSSARASSVATTFYCCLPLSDYRCMPVTNVQSCIQEKGILAESNQSCLDICAKQASSVRSSARSSVRSTPSCLSGDVCMPYTACLDKGGKIKDPGTCNPDSGSIDMCCQLPGTQSSARSSAQPSSRVSSVRSSQRSSVSSATVVSSAQKSSATSVVVPAGRMRVTITRAESTDPAYPVQPIIYLPDETVMAPSGQWFKLPPTPDMYGTVRGVSMMGTGDGRGRFRVNPSDFMHAYTGHVTFYGTIEVSGTQITSITCPEGVWYCPELYRDGITAEPDNDEVWIENGVIHFAIHAKNVTNSAGSLDQFDFTWTVPGSASSARSTFNGSLCPDANGVYDPACRPTMPLPSQPFFIPSQWGGSLLSVAVTAPAGFIVLVVMLAGLIGGLLYRRRR